METIFDKKYQVLARRYRPQRFSDVVGQSAVLQTLKNAVQRGSIAHAYLFAGSRGVGKTTLARLFAKTLNCASLTSDGEPCNQCPSCLDVMSGQSLDVIEIDGASNRGIDDIRQINETVGFAPSYGKYKIYIIDEVHMLTKEAFNALLKTLEEPPERAKFFFATTEPHKVLPTILSRCQRFDLGRLPISQIIEKLQRIAADLSRNVEPAAFHLVARAADGSLRDAESLFDQILCFSRNEKILAAEVRSVLGLVSEDLFFALDSAFSEQRLSFAFELVDDLFNAGVDLAHFLEQLIEHYRHLTVCKTRGAAALQLSSELSARYATSASIYTQQQCFAILDLLLKADAATTRSASSPRVQLELTLLQILRMKNRVPIEALVRRLSELEAGLRSAPVQQPPSTPSRLEAPLQPEATAFPAPVQQSPSQQLTDPLPAKTAELKPMPSPSTSLPEPTQLAEPLPVKPAEFEPAAVQAAPPLPACAQTTEAPLPAPVKQSPSSSPQPAIPREDPETEAKLRLREVPFNPFHSTSAEPTPAPAKAPLPPSPTPTASAPSVHPSHYDILIRFAAVELEGTVKK